MNLVISCRYFPPGPRFLSQFKFRRRKSYGQRWILKNICHFHFILSYSAPVGVRSIVINPSVCESVCLSVCLFVREHISGIAGQVCTKLRVQIPCGRSSVLLRHRWAALCTSGFTDGVTFGHNGQDAERWRLIHAATVMNGAEFDVYECLFKYACVYRVCCVQFIYLDYATTFDRIIHNKFLIKLKCYGISDLLPRPIKSFISNKKQYAKNWCLLLNS